MIEEYKVVAVILAAGSATRMKADQNKAFISIGGIPILARTLMVFDEADFVDEIILVSKAEEIENIRVNIVDNYVKKKEIRIIVGGKERQDSVFNALENIDERENVLVAIQDGARPFVKECWIYESLKAAMEFDGAVVGVASKDTIKIVEHGIIKETLDRTKLLNVQTPQSFRLEIIKEAYRRGYYNQVKATDDSMLVERIGGQVKYIEGSYDNIKITTPEDLFLAENILKGMK
ncbi:MAG: 2-C-methyl-D-erythritol 4-phosphate cytidylyltransferase [Tissierellales bacterium]|nr:2-C-methyl-D-erythritol 4-phosphate cytidylyltransferase [Tissierellales bacterium]